MERKFPRDLQFYKFCGYGFFKNLRFFDPFIMLFFREMGLTFLQIGLLFSIREITTNILEIPTGILSDTMGRRKSMLVSFSAYLLSFSIFYLFGYNFWFSAAGMVLYGAGDTFRSGTHKAMILEYLKIKGILELKVDYYGRTRSCSQIGSALSSIIAAVLVFYSGTYRIVFLASIIPYLIDFLLLMSYPKILDGADTESKTDFRSLWKFTVDSFKEFFHNRNLGKTIINSSMISSSYKVSKDYLQPVVKSWAFSLPVLLSFSDYQRSALLIGLVYFVIHLLSSQASRQAGNLERRVGNFPKALNLNYLINIFIYLTAGLGVVFNLYYLAIAAFIGIFLIQNFQKPIMVGYVSAVTESKRMATILSAENQSRAIAVALFAPVIGLLADHFTVAGGLIGYVILLILFFPLAKVR